MTVQEMIDILSKVEDKTQEIIIEDCEGCMRQPQPAFVEGEIKTNGLFYKNDPQKDDWKSDLKTFKKAIMLYFD